MHETFEFLIACGTYIACVACNISRSSQKGLTCGYRPTQKPKEMKAILRIVTMRVGDVSSSNCNELYKHALLCQWYNYCVIYVLYIVSQVLYVDDDVISLAHFEDVWGLYETVEATSRGGKSYTDLCAYTDINGQCTATGPTQFWSNNRTLYDIEVNTLNDLIDALSAETFPDGSPVNRDIIFGKYSTDSDGRVLSAEGFLTTYTIDGSEGDLLDWELEFIDNMDGFSTALGSRYYIAQRSQNDELAAALGGDLSLLGVTYAIMIIFTCYVTAKGCTPTLTRIGVSLAGIMYIILSMIAGYGFSSGLGVPFNTLHTVLPFIVVGIGVDDIFIITATYDQLERTIADPAERLIATLRKCGLSIAYTTATDVVAFLLGSLSALPAIQQFCLYAAFTLLFNFSFQVTGYCTLLYWDAIRRDKGHWDLLCCLGSVPLTHRTATPTKRKVLAESADNDAAVGAALSGEGTQTGTTEEDVVDLTGLQLFFRDKYHPLIDNINVRIIIALSFLAYFAVSLWAVTEVKVGFDILILTPDESYVRDFIDEGREVGLWLQDEVVPVSMYFKRNDYYMQSVQEEIIDLQVDFVGRAHCDGPVTSWLSDFNEWVQTSDYQGDLNSDGFLTDESVFYQAVGNFTLIPEYSRFERDIIFDYVEASEPSIATITGIRTSRVSAFHKDLEASRAQVQTMQRTRHFVEGADINPDGFAFSGAYIFYETEALLLPELIQNISTALAAVAFVSFFVLYSFRAVVVIFLLVAAIDVDIIGSMFMWDLTLNTVTVVQLVMAVGLVVDYTAHILHYYMEQPAGLTKSEKVKGALVEIGPSVLLGCSTTFLGILPLAFAGTSIFRIFFRMFFSIIVFGGSHGLILLPAILPWLPLREKEHKSRVATTEVLPAKSDGADREDGVQMVGTQGSPDTTTTEIQITTDTKYQHSAVV